MAGINEFSNIEFRLFDQMAGHDSRMFNDRMVQTLYDAALFEHDISKQDRSAILNSLRDYMADNYGVDFDDVFDWEGFREAYDSAQV